MGQAVERKHKNPARQHGSVLAQEFVINEKVQVIPPLISLAFEILGRVGQPQVIVLCHYSMQIWDRSNHGSWHLFGHTHGKLKGIGMSFDVGVDCTDFVPLSLDKVAEKMTHLT